MRTKKQTIRTTKAYKPGEYYKIYLARGSYSDNSIEYFTIGVGLSGDIVSVEYNGQNIRQYNGYIGEKFALDMIDNSNWREIS